MRYQIIDKTGTTPIAFNAVSDLHIDRNLQNHENEIWHEFYFHEDYFYGDLSAIRVDLYYTTLVTYYDEDEINAGGIGLGRRELVQGKVHLSEPSIRRRLSKSEDNMYNFNTELVVLLPYKCDGNL